MYLPGSLLHLFEPRVSSSSSLHKQPSWETGHLHKEDKKIQKKGRKRRKTNIPYHAAHISHFKVCHVFGSITYNFTLHIYKTKQHNKSSLKIGGRRRFFDPIFALSIGFTAAAVRINREEKEKGRTTEQTLEALKRRTSRLVFGTTAAGGAGAGAPVAT